MVILRHKIAEEIEAWSIDYFQRNLKALDAYPLKSARKGRSIIVEPLLHYLGCTQYCYSCVYAGYLSKQGRILNYSFLRH